MPLPATEDFAGGAGALAGSWTQTAPSGAATVNRDGAGLCTQSATDGVADKMARWTGDVWSKDQYSQITVKAVTAGTGYVEAIVRSTGTGASFSCYAFYTNGGSGAGNTELALWNNGVETTLCNFATTFAPGDILAIKIVGSTITCYKNGVVLTPSTGGSSVNNATLNGQNSSPGVGFFWSGGAAPTLDDWVGANVDAPAPLLGNLFVGPVGFGR
jgi:hypothetical protein